MSQNGARRWFSARSALSTLAGLAVVAALVWTTGADEVRAGVVEGIRNVGWMFPAIVALGGARFVMRALAWTLCVDPPHRLAFRQAFGAVLAGDALGNATSLGPVVGEPAKAAFVRHHLAAAPAVTALAIENLFYTLATAGMIAAGMVALLFVFDLRADVRGYSEIAVVLLVCAMAGALVVLWRRPALFSGWLPLVSRPGSRLHSSAGKIRTLENEIYSFAGRRRSAVLPVIALEVAFHALGVLETHLTLIMILPDPPSVLLSFVLETASRVITVVFKFVPLQIGVAESGLGLTTELLGLGTAPGLAFSLVRKARMLAWMAIGAILLVRRGISPGRAMSELELTNTGKP